MKRILRLSILSLIVMLWAVATAQAQSAIAGVVKDTSGAVLPGVSVEAASPVLIEKVRTVVTDGRGQYRIVDLRPGTYTVAFTLTGFVPLRREGIELPASFTATVNADLKVGGVEETLTVTGQTPVVDTRGSVAQSVMSRAVIDAIPTGRDIFAIGQLIPGVTTSSPDVGGSKGMQQPTLQVHGSSNNDNVYQHDGMTLQHVAFSGNQTGFYANDGAYQDVVYQTSALTAESAHGGVQINMIPKEGGNDLHGAVFFTAANESLQANNMTDELRKRGMTANNHLDRIFDFNVYAGGPIKRDRLWWFGMYRRWAADSYMANTFNKDGSQAVDDNMLNDVGARFTWQLSQRNKINLWYDQGWKWRGHRRANAPSGTVFWEPEATTEQNTVLKFLSMIKWYSTVSDRLLLEAAWGAQPVNYNLAYRPEVEPTDIATLDIITGVLSKASNVDTECRGWMYSYVASMSYVTGSHSFKTGVQARQGYMQEAFKVNGDMLLRLRNGVPDSVDTFNTPLTHRENIWDMGIFAQDSWKIARVTLNFGVRFDYFNAGLPAQGAPGGTFMGPRQFDAKPGIIVWNNLVPRVGMVYDLFGDGKTALKASISKYVRMEGTSLVSDINPNYQSSDRRSWKDTNGDGLAQLNELGPSTGFRAGVNRRVDPDIKRPYQWEWVTEINHELMERLSLGFGYYGRKFYDLYAIRNLLVPPSAYIPVTITNPLTSQPLVVYNQDPATRGLVDELKTNVSDLFEDYHGVEVKLTKRFAKGQLTGGFTAGRARGTTTGGDQNNPNNQINNIGNIGYDATYQLRMAGNYILPWDIQLGGSLRMATGLPLNRTLNVGTALVPGLTQVTQSVLVAPRGEYRLEPFNLLDLRFTKIFRFGPAQLEGILDVYNVANTNATTGEVQTVGSSLGRPSEIIEGRLVRIGLQLKF